MDIVLYFTPPDLASAGSQYTLAFLTRKHILVYVHPFFVVFSHLFYSATFSGFNHQTISKTISGFKFLITFADPILNTI